MQAIHAIHLQACSFWMLAYGDTMKRIVDGVTYNTDTSTALAESSWEENDHNGVRIAEHKDTLYQTRGGAFFVHEETTRETWNERRREHKTTVLNNFVPMSPEEAHKWLMTGD